MAYELLIKNGTVVDGTGAARYQADIGVAQGRIVEIAPTGTLNGSATRVIDASDLIVAPGFIDPSHPLRRPGLLGPADFLFFVERGDECGDGKLRGGACAVSTREAGSAGLGFGQCGGDVL